MEAKPEMYMLPLIVENIMRYLSIRELRACQKLCRLWNALATREIHRRQYFVPFSHGPYCGTHHSTHPTYKECKYTYPPELAEDALNRYMEGISTASAHMCIAFVTKGFAAWYEPVFNRYTEDRIYEPAVQLEAKMLIQNSLMRHLSRETIPLLFLTNGIVFWTNDGVPLESEGGFGISGVLIPDDPELQIYSCSPDDIYESKQDNLDKCSLLKRIPKDVDIKCLLLFAESIDLFCKYMNFAEACQDRQSTIIAVGGLLLSSLELYSDTDSDTEMETSLGREYAKDDSSVQSNRVTGSVPYSDTDSEIDSDAPMGRDFAFHNSQVIAFCGESVEAASVTICSLESEETIERSLNKFREIWLGKKKCLAFMLRNSSFDYYHSQELNYESSIFHRLYPDVPLIGAFGKCIIGTIPVPNVAAKSLAIPYKLVKRSYEMHGHKTVFVFIAISMLTECADFTD